MTPELRPIHDRSRRAYLSDTEAMRVEWRRATWSQIVEEREERLQREQRLRQDNDWLAEQIEDLEAENATLQRQNARLSEARDDAERLVSRLAIVTLVLGMIVAALVMTR